MRILVVFMLLSIPFLFIGQQQLISAGATWKYYDQGQAPLEWKNSDFNDASWNSGNAELGYGDGDENTTVSYGPNSSNKHMTTYFRHSFFVVNPQSYGQLNFSLLRDDGAVVYVNGTEVWRSNMPVGPISFTTPSSGTVAWPFEDDWYDQSVSALVLQPGNNVVAVEIHQDEPSSSDISFDLSLQAVTQNPVIIRGPYLQKATNQSVIIRWRTDIPSDTRLRYGSDAAILNNEITDALLKTDHEVEITGLSPASMYFYGIGGNGITMAQGPNFYFETLPLEGSEDIYSFVVLGDAGTGYQEQLDAKNALLQYAGNNHFDGVLLLGDNAYQSGFDNEYQENFFGNKYNEIFENTIIWPAPGNHDYNNNIPFSPDPAYFEIFNCPTQGECGGVPSGTEKYYSFNYGNIHFISLDSYNAPRSADGAMAQWIQQDLQANDLPWVIVYFHHPPYTKGSHDSDNTFFLDGELVDMRENIIPILENYGVDLVLNGHSHSYERSFLIDGHYGESDTFGEQHKKDGGSGSYPEECPYRKSTANGTGHLGAVYTVLGCSGKTSDVQSDWPHPAMYSYTAEKVGTMLLTVEKNRLDAIFLTKEGSIYDKFSILKDAGTEQVLHACPGDQLTMVASWPGEVVWNPGSVQTASFTITTFADAIVTASDASGCVQDIFEIDVVQDDSCSQLNIGESLQVAGLPEIKLTGKKLKIEYDQDLSFKIISVEGREAMAFEMKKQKHIQSLEMLNEGIYYLYCESLGLLLKFYLHE